MGVRPGALRQGAGGELNRPRPAATVALLRRGTDGPEVLLTRRPATMVFGPGLHVFPGGAVDPGDADPRLIARSTLSPAACAAAWAGDLGPDAAVAHGVAALRELYEEAGVLLATGPDDGPVDPTAADVARRAGTSFVALVLGLDLRLRTDLLVPLSRWVTPVGLSRRYDARFFVAWLPPGAAVDHDRREVVDHAWLRPAEALAAMASGRIGLWPPTSTTLQQLAAVHEARDVVDHLAPRAPAAAPVTDVVAPDVVRIRLGGAAGIPGNRVNAYLVGRRRVVVVDPGDPNDASVDAIFAAAEARGAGITAVLLTGPVPDHAAGATSVAARAGVPVLAAPGAAAVLPGPFEPLGEGRAPDLSDTLIRVLGTPGPHPDHLAFDLPDAGAVLTGDLDGGPLRGTAGRADEWERSRSAARIDALGPRTRLPAHGGEDR